jgi:hypothetical protein
MSELVDKPPEVVAQKMRDTFNVCGDRWFKIAADLIEAQAAALSRPSTSEDVARLEAEVASAKAHVAAFIDRAEYADSYGVEGSGFMSCMLCQGGGAPGIRLVHNDDCPCKGVPEQYLDGWKEHQEEVSELKTCLGLAEARALAAESAAARLREALEPFASDDLCRTASGNIEGDASPVYQRDNAVLLLGDFRRARAALIGTGDGWREIESAPKDGTPVWLYRGDCDAFLGRWIAPVDFMTADELEEHNIPDAIAEEADWFFSDFVAGGRVVDGAPTHWRPLPSPPSGRETKGDAS